MANCECNRTECQNCYPPLSGYIVPKIDNTRVMYSSVHKSNMTLGANQTEVMDTRYYVIKKNPKKNIENI